MGHQQVDDEGLQADSVLQRTGYGVGEPALGAGQAFGAFLDLGIDAAFDDLEHDVEEDAAFPADRIDVREAAATGLAVLDGDRLLDGGLAQAGAGLLVLLRALAAGALAPCGLVLVRLGRRQAGVLRPLASRLFQQDCDQDAQQGDEDTEHCIDIPGHLAVRTQRRDAAFSVAITRSPPP